MTSDKDKTQVTIDTTCNLYSIGEMDGDPFAPGRALGRSPERNALAAMMQNRGAPRSLAATTPVRKSASDEVQGDQGNAGITDCNDLPNFQSMLCKYEEELEKLEKNVSDSPTTARKIKDQVQVLKREFFKIKTAQPLTPEPAVAGCECRGRVMKDAASQVSLSEERRTGFQSRLLNATTDEMKADLMTTNWPTDAFAHSHHAALGAALAESSVRVVILPRDASGENIRELSRQTAGLQMILDSDDLKDGSCAALRGSLDVEIDGVHLERSGLLSSVTIVGRPDRSIASRELATLLILRTIMSHIEGVKRFSVITGCGVGRTMKAIEFLLSGSDRIAAVVDSVIPNDKRKAVKVPETSSVVTIRGEGQSYADLLKKVKANVDIDKLGIKVAAITRRQDETMSIRIKGDSKKATLLLKEVNKTVGVTAVAHRKMDMVEVRDLEHGMSKDDISSAFAEAIPGSSPADFVVTSVTPSYAGTSRAFIRAPSECFGQIAENNRIRIGWVSCRIRRRSMPTHCYRCWSSDHLSSQCKGPDRSKHCYKCGGPNHLKARCTAEKWCPLCETNDHCFDDGDCRKKNKSNHGKKH